MLLWNYHTWAKWAGSRLGLGSDEGSVTGRIRGSCKSQSAQSLKFHRRWVPNLTLYLLLQASREFLILLGFPTSLLSADPSLLIPLLHPQRSPPVPCPVVEVLE